MDTLFLKEFSQSFLYTPAFYTLQKENESTDIIMNAFVLDMRHIDA